MSIRVILQKVFGFGVHRTRRKDTKINNEQKQLGQDEKHSADFGNVFRGLFINFFIMAVKKVDKSTGKSFSEALILASTNPQYDKGLFMELPRKLEAHNMDRTWAE